MAISDGQFRAGVVGTATLLVLGITVVRFCGSVSLPPKTIAEPVSQTGAGNSSTVVDESNASPVVYQDYLSKDAGIAGVRTPTLDEMSRVLPYESSGRRQVLEVGQTIEAAGLKLTAQRQGDVIALEIVNVTQAVLAYHVVSEPTPKIAGCNSVPPLQFNAMIIAKGEHQVRVECAWRSGMAIAITKVESVEVAPLSAWYLNQLPPSQVGIEDRIARGHRIPRGAERCISLSSQAVRNGIENGEIGWRDLVDFYARHRCQTYQFPASYRAITQDGQRRIPAT